MIVSYSVTVFNTKNIFVTTKTKLDILNSMFSVLIPGAVVQYRNIYSFDMKRLKAGL